MSFVQAIIMALLQGISELFPISSLGHAVILPKLLGWQIDQQSPDFLPFLVVMHFGTATALLLYFWRDWFGFAKAVLSAQTPQECQERQLFWLLVIATLPAAIIGFVMRKLLGDAFASPLLAALCLILNGGLLFAGDRLRNQTRGTLAQLNWKGALMIGFAQSFALIPGISRSGITLCGGLILGLGAREAARFSFLMATPIIFGATLAEAPKLLGHGSSLGSLALLAGVIAGLAAYASVVVLMRYFKNHDEEPLAPFGWYCVGAGILAAIWLLFVVR